MLTETTLPVILTDIGDSHPIRGFGRDWSHEKPSWHVTGVYVGTSRLLAHKLHSYNDPSNPPQTLAEIAAHFAPVQIAAVRGQKPSLVWAWYAGQAREIWEAHRKHKAA
jgi:hypothetical protein